MADLKASWYVAKVLIFVAMLTFFILVILFWHIIITDFDTIVMVNSYKNLHHHTIFHLLGQRRIWFRMARILFFFLANDCSHHRSSWNWLQKQ